MKEDIEPESMVENKAALFVDEQKQKVLYIVIYIHVACKTFEYMHDFLGFRVTKGKTKHQNCTSDISVA
jgi:hypothetical protein